MFIIMEGQIPTLKNANHQTALFVIVEVLTLKPTIEAPLNARSLIF